MGECGIVFFGGLMLAKLNRLILGVIILSLLLLLNSYYFLGHERYMEFPSSNKIIY